MFKHPMSKTHVFAWGGVGALLLLILLMVGLLSSVAAITPSDTPVHTPTGVRPLAPDPRLSITLAYPFRGENGYTSATSFPMDYLPNILHGDFVHTEGVLYCNVMSEVVFPLVVECLVAPGLDVIEMAELLRLLANRQYFGITLDLTLDDGLTRTNYLWEDSATGWIVTGLPPVPPEQQLLHEVARTLCNMPHPSFTFWLDDPTYSLSCVLGVGHGTHIAIQRFDDLAAAASAFEEEIAAIEKADEHFIEPFHNYPAAGWLIKGMPTVGGQIRTLLWQADRWLVRISSSDDTHFIIALDPFEVAENLYDTAIRIEMLPAPEPDE